ncbi:ABC transporter permease [Azospirillum griseum]|uniref:ABC transporter permease n=1 Tax=Azospirillum griseum TaxID=2496639 RepID=A0A3S0K9D7_9PROT|nr:ABC transporter permease [Azospirillum griseum]RTR17634.1 ABC transporter permease [Azospirillum griseum]
MIRPSRGQWAGVALLLLLALFALGVPQLIPGDPTRQSLSNALLPPGGPFPLGTDAFGRDMVLRLAAAIRLSLGIALLTTALAGVIGVALGVLAGACGGWVDRALCGVADTLLALPGLLLVLLLVAIAPGQFWPLYLGVSLVLWVEYFRMTRAAALRIAASPAVEASRLLGFGPVYRFRRHYWPELAPITLTVGAFGSATSVMSVAALGFVNVGVRPPTPELGQMMIELMPYYNEAPLILAQPILVVFLLVLALNLIAGGKTQ